MLKMWVWSLVREDPLEKDIATHSSIIAWKILWTEETGRLQSRVVTESQLQLSTHTVSLPYMSNIVSWLEGKNFSYF